MNSRKSEIVVRSPGDRSPRHYASAATQLYSVPPLPAERGGRPLEPTRAPPDIPAAVSREPQPKRLSAPHIPVGGAWVSSRNTTGVSMLATVAVGAAAAPKRTLPPPRRVRVPPLIQELTEPTLIFLDSTGPSDVRHAQLSRETPSAAFASAAFAPVPNVLFSLTPRAESFPSSPPAPPASATSVPHSTAVLKGKAHPPAQPLAAPLLRAFDHDRPRAPSWTTAKTINASLASIAKDGSVKAKVFPDAPIAARDEEALRRHGPARFLERLRPSRAATKISALVVTAAAVVALGTVAGRTLAKGIAPDPAASSESSPKSEAPTPEPSARSASAVPVVDAQEPDEAAHRDRASPVLESGASAGVTLARQAVDALLAGDRARALLHYEELSRTAPDREVYREAVRLLAPSAPARSQ